MACSGHECTASRTASSWSGGTTSFTGDDVPSMSLSSKESGAIIEHSVCPWHRPASTKTFMMFLFSAVVVVPLEVAAGVHPDLHAGDVAGFVRRQPQHGVADVDGLDPRHLHCLLDVEDRLGVGQRRVLEV